VAFDENKEEFAVIHHIHGEGPDFRLLGPIIDTKLLMHSAVAKLVGKIRPKLQSLLRSNRFYNTKDMVTQFKTHILCMAESCVGAIYHAADTTLAPLDRQRDHFLNEIGVSSRSGFLTFNLAPLGMRRDIAMLGLLHKCSLGLAHPDLCALFPPAPPEQTQERYSTRLRVRRHDKQISDICQGHQLDMVARSVFGLVRIYNLLPPAIVEASTIKSFQKALTQKARDACENNTPMWQLLYSPRL
jgi:hypothetical protein